MEFEYSDRCQELQAKLLTFMDEHIYPNEKAYKAEIDRNGVEKGNRWLPTRIIEDLKPNLVLDFFAGHHFYQADYAAQPDPLGIPTMTDLTTGLSNGPNLGQDHRPRKQTQITGSVSV